jgi:tRNA modification GTPase
MPYTLDDTIAAIASPPGGAARGIIRLTGPDVRACVDRVFRPESSPLPFDGRGAGGEGSTTTLSVRAWPSVRPGSLVLSGLASPLPCACFLWPEGRSYTGQPVAEIHTLGSRPLLEAALRAFCEAGARLAEPGEFTLRAFLAGRIDLTRAEAVLGVIDAADAGELEVALAQLAGGLSAPLGQLRERLLDLSAHLEAGFDFADEELPFISNEEIASQLAEAIETVSRLAEQMSRRQEASHLVRVVLVGWPNTGKSSLFNALAGRAAALVSEHAGTTRDYVTAEVHFGGQACVLVDTAGAALEATLPQSGPDREARQAASQQARRAGVRLFCLDSSRPLNGWEQEELQREVAGRVLVLTKVDAPRCAGLPWAGLHCAGLPWADLAGPAVETSSRTGEGIDRLRETIGRMALAAAFSGNPGVAGTAIRCRESLRTAAESLRRAAEVLRAQAGEELVACEIRIALEALGQVVGAVYTEDVLQRIFSRFCVGK